MKNKQPAGPTEDDSIIDLRKRKLIPASAKSAGIFSVGALWGALDREALIASKPDALCETVAELRTLIFERA